MPQADTRRLNITYLGAGLITLLLLAHTSVSAHSGIHERIEHVTESIRQQPNNPDLLVDRALLYSEHHDWQAALEDIHKARRLSNPQDITDYPHALILWEQYLAQGSPKLLDSALKYSNRAVAHQPANFHARQLRARISRASGDVDKALTDYTYVIENTSKPAIDLYIETARLWHQTHHPDKAIDLLEDSLRPSTGASIPIIRLAMEIAMEQQQPLIALKWWERLPAILKTLPDELLHKGDLLQQASRHDAAQNAYCEARKQLGGLPAWRRQKPNLKNVGAALQKRLKQACK